VESEESFHLLVDAVTDYAIYMLDPKGRVATWNKGAERSKGWKAEEIVGQHYSVFFAPEEVAAGMPEKELAVARREGRFQAEGWRVRKDGSRFWASVTLTAIRGPNGKLRGFAKVTQDLTQQKAAEEELRRRNAALERYQIIVQSIDEHAIYTLDPEGRITSWETGAQNISGAPLEQVVGRHYSMWFEPQDVAAGVPEHHLAEAARTGRYMSDCWMVNFRRERVWSSGVVSAIRDETGKLTGFLRVARDMTRHKEMELALERQAEDLEIRVKERTRELETTVGELERKNEEVEAFVYIVSHDLRAPLVNVQGFSAELESSCKHLQELLDREALPEALRSTAREILVDEMGGALHFISASASKFERLIDALLRLSRQGRQVYRWGKVDVQSLVAGAEASLQQQIAEAGATVKVGTLPQAYGDIAAVDQVFSNLLGNSLKYRSTSRPLQLEIGGEADGAMVRYWVRDNGLGIPTAAMPKLFQVFQRFHRQQAEGEGMGLAIVQRIVERHGGKIWAESEEGRGSTFFLTLPGTSQGAPRAAQDAKNHENV
jgi:PAS domain S-box-containing protein